MSESEYQCAIRLMARGDLKTVDEATLTRLVQATGRTIDDARDDMLDVMREEFRERISAMCQEAREHADELEQDRLADEWATLAHGEWSGD